jgi:hypothetical protein
VASHKLILNAVAIGLPEVKVTTGHLPYDKDVLEELRRQRTGELLAQRHEDGIEAIPLVAEATVEPPTVPIAKMKLGLTFEV